MMAGVGSQLLEPDPRRERETDSTDVQTRVRTIVMFRLLAAPKDKRGVCAHIPQFLYMVA
jgi:hypothetical protein